MIARQVLAEGVKEQCPCCNDRKYLAQVQTRLRDVAGVSVIIYEQTCAAEKRRRRKRGLMEVPNRRLFINHRVCEARGLLGAIQLYLY